VGVAFNCFILFELSNLSLKGSAIFIRGEYEKVDKKYPIYILQGYPAG